MQHIVKKKTVMQRKTFFRAKRERKNLSLFVALMEKVCNFAVVQNPKLHMKHLTEGQRYEISAYLNTGMSQNEIGQSQPRSATFTRSGQRTPFLALQS